MCAPARRRVRSNKSDFFIEPSGQFSTSIAQFKAESITDIPFLLHSINGNSFFRFKTVEFTVEMALVSCFFAISLTNFLKLKSYQPKFVVEREVGK